MTTRINEVHIKRDKETRLFAVVAIHDPLVKSSLGGCRCIEYDSEGAAIQDAIDLAEAMSFKTTIGGVGFGGGKAVLMKPRSEFDRVSYFESFGKFIEELGGKLITGCDSGVSQEDMRVAARHTKYMTAIPPLGESKDYLIELTVAGILRSIEIAVRHQLGKDKLQGLTVAIQGLGKVGYSLAAQLHFRGCRLIVCDVNEGLAVKASSEFDAKLVSPEEIYQIHCDVFAPCGLGRVINERTILQLNTPIVCGGANNQLSSEEIGKKLFEMGIIYVPDFVANVGGTIFAAGSYCGVSPAAINEYTVLQIEQVLQKVLEISAIEKKPIHIAAKDLAIKMKVGPQKFALA